MHQLVTALQACDHARLSFAEILEVVHPHLPEDDDVSILGPLIERLRDNEAETIIRIAYGALPNGAAFSFSDRQRSVEQLEGLCHDGCVGELATITEEGRSRRVVIQKPPS